MRVTAGAGIDPTLGQGYWNRDLDVADVRAGIRLLASIVKEADQPHAWGVGRMTGNRDGRVSNRPFSRELDKYLFRHDDPILERAVRDMFVMTGSSAPTLARIDQAATAMIAEVDRAVGGRAVVTVAQQRELIASSPRLKFVFEFADRYRGATLERVVTGR